MFLVLQLVQERSQGFSASRNFFDNKDVAIDTEIAIYVDTFIGSVSLENPNT